MTPTQVQAGWILAAFCLALAAPLILINWCIVIFNWRHRYEGKHSSWVPLLGGVLGGLAVWFVPAPAIKSFWWLPLVLDFGCLLGMGWTAVFWLGYSMGWHKPRYVRREPKR